MIEKFPNLMSDTIPQIQEVESARKAIPMYIEYWSGLPFPTPGIFLTKGSNLYLSHLLHWQEGSLPVVPPGKPISILQDSKDKK